MEIEHLVGKRLPDEPKDAQTPGHRLLLRGGYIRQVGQGIYSLLPLAFRICHKIENIIRDEMNNIGGQEIQMPVVAPADLWRESGRFDAIGPELLRFTDRTHHDCVLNMTHEEVVVDLARGNIDSYRQLPFMIYQIQTKFRDEARSRGGLIRVREFIMKDAYSFHHDWEDLKSYYDEVHAAYVRIYKRCGAKQVIDIESDSGMMGGSVAHEFMLVSEVGEDTLVICKESGYRANREVAKAAWNFDADVELQELTKVVTPGQKTIEEVTGFLNSTPEKACKNVAFVADGKPVFAFVRGDFDVNQAKLKNALGGVTDLRAMEEDEFESLGTIAGFVGPVGLDSKKVTILFDESVVKSSNLIIGANEVDMHSTGFNVARDFGEVESHDLKDVREGDPCPISGKPLELTRGIEVGNIFQLGSKYSEALSFTIDDEDGKASNPLMGCYGIGVGRTMASILEESHDKFGPFWPMAIAPFQVQICCLQAKKEEIRAEAVKLYEKLKALGVEVLIDKRDVRPGFMFADADLVGAPIRLVVSKRNLENSAVEVKFRVSEPDDSLPSSLPLDQIETEIPKLIAKIT